jgi:hypothetical protein
MKIQEVISNNNNNDFLYHYSDKRFAELQTLLAQRALTKKEIVEYDRKMKREYGFGEYYKHISFFIDPVPTMLVGNLFPKNHKIWYIGNEMYEYCVRISKLEENIKYALVESPDDVAIRDETPDEVYFNEVQNRLFDKKHLQRKIASGEYGFGLDNLKHQIQKYKGKISSNFLKASKRKDFNEFSMLYAASVPHLMLYPSTGVIEIDSIAKITIGKPR